MKEVVNSGIGFASLMFLLFLGLKLGHVIGWSWWWVTAPLWMPIAIFFGVLLLLAVIGGIIWYWQHD